MKKYLHKSLIKEMAWALGGAFLFSCSINILITPLGLYNGGFTGLAQLIRTLLIQNLNLELFLLNIQQKTQFSSSFILVIFYD